MALTDRELSERLSALAGKIEEIVNELGEAPGLLEVIDELRKLSNEKYTPGHTSWADLKKKVQSTKRTYRQGEKEMPF